jgi:hypothetical protein
VFRSDLNHLDDFRERETRFSSDVCEPHRPSSEDLFQSISKFTTLHRIDIHLEPTVCKNLDDHHAPITWIAGHHLCQTKWQALGAVERAGENCREDQKQSRERGRIYAFDAVHAIGVDTGAAGQVPTRRAMLGSSTRWRQKNADTGNLTVPVRLGLATFRSYYFARLRILAITSRSSDASFSSFVGAQASVK